MIARAGLFRFWPLALAGVCWQVGGSCWAQADGNRFADFNEAYAAYTAAVSAGDVGRAVAAARQAYEYGAETFGRDDPNFAALAMNYGNALVGVDPGLAAELFVEADALYQDLDGPVSLNRVEALTALATVQANYDDRLRSLTTALRLYRELLPDDDVAYAVQQAYSGEVLAAASPESGDAAEMLIDALEILEKAYGKDSPELVPVLFSLGSVSSEGRRTTRAQLKYFERAQEILQAASPGNPETAADFELRIANRLAANVEGYSDALPYFAAALTAFRQLFGADHPKTALAELAMGQALIATRDLEQGQMHTENAVAFFEGKPEYVSGLLRARRQLLSIFLDLGDEAGFASQLEAIGLESAGSGDYEEPVVLVKFAPVYPPGAAAARANGFVVVEYTVDAAGRVVDPVVVDSGSEPGLKELFHQPALDSIRRYRYIPRFENGVPVSSPNVTTRIEFVLDF